MIRVYSHRNIIVKNMINIIFFVIRLFSLLYMNDIEMINIIQYHILYITHQVKQSSLRKKESCLLKVKQVVLQ